MGRRRWRSWRRRLRLRMRRPRKPSAWHNDATWRRKNRCPGGSWQVCFVSFFIFFFNGAAASWPSTSCIAELVFPPVRSDLTRSFVRPPSLLSCNWFLIVQIGRSLLFPSSSFRSESPALCAELGRPSVIGLFCFHLLSLFRLSGSFRPPDRCLANQFNTNRGAQKRKPEKKEKERSNECGIAADDEWWITDGDVSISATAPPTAAGKTC